MSTTDLEAVARALAAPFDPGEVKYKPQHISGNRALAVPFVDARVVMDRLDAVLGVDGWKDHYDMLADGAVKCALSLRVGGEWITREDVGGQSEQPDEGDRVKAAVSDALKRAAVKWGVGRYLYRIKPQWVDYDPHKRQLLSVPALPASPGPAPDQVAEAAVAWVRRKEAEWVLAGLCRGGEVVARLEREFGKDWHGRPAKDVRKAAEDFRAEREAEAERRATRA